MGPPIRVKYKLYNFLIYFSTSVIIIACFLKNNSFILIPRNRLIIKIKTPLLLYALNILNTKIFFFFRINYK